MSLETPSNYDSGRGRRVFRFLRRRAFKSHGILLSIAIHADAISRQYFAFENLHRQRILNQTLDGAPQRPRAVGGIVALFEQQRASPRE